MRIGVRRAFQDVKLTFKQLAMLWYTPFHVCFCQLVYLMTQQIRLYAYQQPDLLHHCVDLGC